MLHFPLFEIVEYGENALPVCWHGIRLSGGDAFDAFLADNVRERLDDAEAAEDYEQHLRGLAGTGFAQENLDRILAANVQENRDWAIGEAIAEAWLLGRHNVLWPWNLERDKRIASASLPGADLVGLAVDGEHVVFALGEVKTSSDADTPPGVMNGRTGMIHQLEAIASDLSILGTILKWLFFRCKGTEYEEHYNIAAARLFESGNLEVRLFGVLIRDTVPNELDLRNRRDALAGIIADPTQCNLIALYLPCRVEDLPGLVRGGAA